ncbi:hypothetical protein [Photorhabdus africana]|uniref:hypothetical protein n=1 Tax=Photorhabdus africana TaxID=3097554 RepID=UPI002B414E6C|nr:hypothetical protein [Photorhabdus sp. CRI-LC]
MSAANTIFVNRIAVRINIITDIPIKIFGCMGESHDDTFLSEEAILLWGFIDIVGYLIIRMA